MTRTQRKKVHCRRRGCGRLRTEATEFPKGEKHKNLKYDVLFLISRLRAFVNKYAYRCILNVEKNKVKYIILHYCGLIEKWKTFKRFTLISLGERNINLILLCTKQNSKIFTANVRTRIKFPTRRIEIIDFWKMSIVDLWLSHWRTTLKIWNRICIPIRISKTIHSVYYV